MRSRKAISSDEDPGSRRRKGQAQVLRRGLEEDNHAVSLAHDGPSALSPAQDTQFDLVLARRDAAWNQRDSGRAPISRTPARHCGSIEGQSTLGNGSVFCITLPMATNRYPLPAFAFALALNL